MSKQKAVFFLGIWLAILPFLGFPGAWKRTLALISGAGVAYIGYLLNKERLLSRAPDTAHAAFAESKTHEHEHAA